MAHTDHLLGLRPRGPGSLSREDRVWGLLELASHLQHILVPVAPDADFRRRLHGELILAAQARELEPAVSRLRQHRKGIIIGALLGSAAASVAGVAIALFVRHRHGGGGRMAAA